MTEQDINIEVNGQYKNIYLKPNPKKGQKGLDVGNFIVVTKQFAEGRAVQGKFVKPFYSAGVLYKDEQCSFLLNSTEHDQYKTVGGIGDKITITMTEVTATNSKTGVKMILPRLVFELVQ